MKKTIIILAILFLCSISVFSQSKRKWEATKSKNTIESYQEFIKDYPNGEYTSMAKQELERLQKIQDKKIDDAKKILLKIVPDMSLEEVMKIIDYDKYINRNFKKGIYVGNNGIFTEDPTKQSEFSGIASVKGYKIEFNNGKVVSVKLIPNELDTKGVEFVKTNGQTLISNPELLLLLPD